LHPRSEIDSKAQKMVFKKKSKYFLEI